MWTKYLKYIKSKTKIENIKNINFRDKTYGWHNYSMKINDGNKKYIYKMITLTIPMFQTTRYQILYARNMHRARSIIYLINAIINIIASIIFINLFGTIGAAMGTALAMFLGNSIFINIYYKYKLKLKLKQFLLKYV